jgi:DNA invertase Pin-like site-specific DNA recombinase
MLAVFAEFERDILRDRRPASLKRELMEAARPGTNSRQARSVQLCKQRLSKRAIANGLSVSRTSVIRLLRP